MTMSDQLHDTVSAPLGKHRKVCTHFIGVCLDTEGGMNSVANGRPVPLVELYLSQVFQNIVITFTD